MDNRNGGTMLRLINVSLAEKGLSQKELAYQLGIDEAEVSRAFSSVNKIEKILAFLGLYIERNEREKSLWTLAQELARTLGMSEELKEQSAILQEENMKLRQRLEALKSNLEKT